MKHWWSRSKSQYWDSKPLLRWGAYKNAVTHRYKDWTDYVPDGSQGADHSYRSLFLASQSLKAWAANRESCARFHDGRTLALHIRVPHLFLAVFLTVLREVFHHHHHLTNGASAAKQLCQGCATPKSWKLGSDPSFPSVLSPFYWSWVMPRLRTTASKTCCVFLKCQPLRC